MPDTAVLKTPSGWIDRDSPNQVFRVRREARDYRRGRVKFNKPSMVASTPMKTSQTVTTATMSVNAGGSIRTTASTLSHLQRKLYDRLIYRQGVGHDDAIEILTTNGYNKAASYGHMRAAGARHAEAKIVIDLENPDVSVAYGRKRAAGLNHTDALAEALKDDGDD
jgi:hypothetical protein